MPAEGRTTAANLRGEPLNLCGETSAADLRGRHCCQPKSAPGASQASQRTGEYSRLDLLASTQAPGHAPGDGHGLLISPRRKTVNGPQRSDTTRTARQNSISPEPVSTRTSYTPSRP